MQIIGGVPPMADQFALFGQRFAFGGPFFPCWVFSVRCAALGAGFGRTSFCGGREALARGYGIPAVRTARPDELAVAAKEAFSAAGGPHMILVDIATGVRLRG
jgi:hypothetical protein